MILSRKAGKDGSLILGRAAANSYMTNCVVSYAQHGLPCAGELTSIKRETPIKKPFSTPKT